MCMCGSRYIIKIHISYCSHSTMYTIISIIIRMKSLIFKTLTIMHTHKLQIIMTACSRSLSLIVCIGVHTLVESFSFKISNFSF